MDLMPAVSCVGDSQKDSALSVFSLHNIKHTTCMIMGLSVCSPCMYNLYCSLKETKKYSKISVKWLLYYIPTQISLAKYHINYLQELLMGSKTYRSGRTPDG